MTSRSLVFSGGRVLTMDPARPEAEAVAVREGRILATGSEAEVATAAGPGAESVDMAGGTLLPGFQDAHVHPLAGGVGLEQCDLSGVHAVDDYLHAARRWAAGHPDAEWVRGSGWYRDAFPAGSPHRRDLDRVVPDRPAYFTGHDGHTAWVNSATLALAGIDAGTPDPAHGRIERDTSGEPTGVLVEAAATLVADLLPGHTTSDLRQGMLTAQRYLHSLGITAWQDAIVGDYLGMPDPFDTYRELEADGLLTARVRGALWFRPRARAAARPPRAARRDRGRPLPRRHREDHAGRDLRELHRRHARPLPRRKW
jgi:predicted amidohydrolase YtcJ